jgi:hypothetical protein
VIVTPSLKFIGAGPLAASDAATAIGGGTEAPVASPAGAVKPVATEPLHFIGIGK